MDQIVEVLESFGGSGRESGWVLESGKQLRVWKSGGRASVQRVDRIPQRPFVF